MHTQGDVIGMLRSSVLARLDLVPTIRSRQVHACVERVTQVVFQTAAVAAGTFVGIHHQVLGRGRAEARQYGQREKQTQGKHHHFRFTKTERIQFFKEETRRRRLKERRRIETNLATNKSNKSQTKNR
jgi:hypothetical protein